MMSLTRELISGPGPVSGSPGTLESRTLSTRVRSRQSLPKWASGGHHTCGCESRAKRRSVEPDREQHKTKTYRGSAATVMFDSGGSKGTHPVRAQCSSRTRACSESASGVPLVFIGDRVFRGSNAVCTSRCLRLTFDGVGALARCQRIVTRSLVVANFPSDGNASIQH